MRHQINVSNYALMLENKVYADQSIEFPLNEAGSVHKLYPLKVDPDQQTEAALTNIKSGANGGAYVNQWNQLITSINEPQPEAHKNDGTVHNYTFMIFHDDNKTPMTYISYQMQSGKYIKGSVKLNPNWKTDPFYYEKPATVAGQNIDINKIATYDPKGKMNEFIAALITVSIEKFGKSWTKAHIDWVNGQINKCKALGGFYGTITTYASRPFLTGTGDVSAKISALTGGDKDAVTGLVNDASLKIAGSANTAAKLNVVLVAMNGKLGESFISFQDEESLIAMYQLISPGFGSGQISTAWTALGRGGSPLANIIEEIDTATGAHAKGLMVWAIGVRGLTATNADAIRLTGFDTASYSASLAQIKAALV